MKISVTLIMKIHINYVRLTLQVNYYYLFLKKKRCTFITYFQKPRTEEFIELYSTLQLFRVKISTFFFFNQVIQKLGNQ